MIKGKNLKIILLGSPISGKGTQAEMLSKKLGIPHISTGNIFRYNIQKKTKLGKIAAKLINQGKFVPDDITNQLLDKSLRKIKNGFILDGYPRNLNQARALEKISLIDYAFFVKISDKEAIQRITGRRVCLSCGRVYHLKYQPPKKKGICDFCQKELIHREDDSKEVIQKRLKIYHQNTEPLIDYYRQKGILIEINGEQPIEKVQRDILKKIFNFQSSIKVEDKFSIFK